MRLLDKLERKMGKFYIPNLILYVLALTGIVYIMALFGGDKFNLMGLILIPDRVLAGEVWRIITFVFVEPLGSPIFFIFVLYFYYMAGKGLEQEWGEFKFNVYYFTGVLVTIIISFLTGVPAIARFINLSLFLAFARIYPDYEILLFFAIPLKIRYLGWFTWAKILYDVVMIPGIMNKIAQLTPAIIFLIFFGRDLVGGSKSYTKNYKRKREFDSKVIQFKDIPRHKCVVCGITEKDDPDMQFRYCSKCSGNKCYCIDHIGNHEHK